MGWWRVRAAAGVVRDLIGGSGDRVAVGRPCPGADRLSVRRVDHAGYDRLLRKYVNGQGLVSYAAWKGNPDDLSALDAYLVQLGRADPRLSASKSDLLAYWVNAYNAVTLAGVLREYPTGCACRRGGFFGHSLWRDVRLWVGESLVSLDRIEHQFLRPLGEPRVHFALVCAARGCPPLWDRAYTADGLGEQLDANARRFFARPDAVRVEPGRRVVSLSRLLKWYGADFARTPAERVRMLRPYFPAGLDLGWIDGGGFRVTYTDYDWSLNDAAPGPRCVSAPGGTDPSRSET